MDPTKDDKLKEDEYDSPWKEAIREYFPEFLQFFFPEVAAEIEWTKGIEFLDKELQKVVREAASQDRSVDQLIKVWRKPAPDSDEAGQEGKSAKRKKKKKENRERWVYIHVDVQGDPKTFFEQRMFIYNYRLFDRYKIPIATLVILGDDKAWWHPKEYSHELWGCRVKMEFPTVKLLDYEEADNWSELEQSHNPFAIIVMAHLHTKKTKHKPNERFELKWRLTRSLYERGYSKKDILSLYRFINWMMALPPELEQELDQKVTEYEEEQKMPYITTMERRGIEKGLSQGLSQGLKQGLEKGLERGIVKNARENVILVLQSRFGQPSPALAQRVNLISEEAVLRMLLQHSATVDSVATFEQKLAESVGESRLN